MSNPREQKRRKIETDFARLKARTAEYYERWLKAISHD